MPLSQETSPCLPGGVPGEGEAATRVSALLLSFFQGQPDFTRATTRRALQSDKASFFFLGQHHFAAQQLAAPFPPALPSSQNKKRPAPRTGDWRLEAQRSGSSTGVPTLFPTCTLRCHPLTCCRQAGELHRAKDTRRRPASPFAFGGPTASQRAQSLPRLLAGPSSFSSEASLAFQPSSAPGGCCLVRRVLSPFPGPAARCSAGRHPACDLVSPSFFCEVHASVLPGSVPGEGLACPCVGRRKVEALFFLRGT